MKYRLLFFLISLSAVIAAAEPDPESVGIRLNNRILLKVNGKAITVLDLSKRLDLLFFRQYAHLKDLPQARYQFYRSNWRAVLDLMIDDELMLADAKEKKITITDGEVREEMETMLGPDVVASLNQLDWTYDEAMKLLREQLIVRRMVQMMVRSKATVAVQPTLVRKLYEKQIAQEKPEELWSYQTLTVEGSDQQKVIETLGHVRHQLIASELTQEAAISYLRKQSLEARLASFERKSSDLSEAHKKVLTVLQPGHYSDFVVTQKEGMCVGRLFYLRELKPATVTAFNEVEKQLTAELMQKAIAKESQAYAEKLRGTFGITKDYLSTNIPDDFQPFGVR